MTIKQYQKLAATIASKINDLGGNARTVRNLHRSTTTSIEVRDPKQYADIPVDYLSGSSNATIEFDTISNPNNPNAKFRTLKAGSMSVYNSQTGKNVDITDFNFDSSQFKVLVDTISQDGWNIAG